MKRLIFPCLIIGLILATGSALQAQIYLDTDTMSVTDTYGSPGDTVGIPLKMANRTLAVGGYTARIVFDANILEFVAMECVDRGCQLEGTAGESPEDSVVVILAYSLSSRFIPRGSGPVGIMNFRVKPGAQPGSMTTLRFVNDPPDAINAWTDSLGFQLYVPVLVTGNFSVTGGGSNQPPVIGNIGPQEVAEGQVLQFTVSAHDPNGDPITLSASNLPQNSTFPTMQGDSTVAGTFTFAPSFSQGPDTFYVNFVAADDHNNTNTMTVQIVVLDQPNDILIVESDQGGVPGAVGRDVAVTLFNSKPVYGIQFSYIFDPSQIQITDVVPTERCSDLGFWFNYPEAGRIIVLIFSPGLDAILAGNGPIVNFKTDVSPNAIFGRTPVALDSAIEVIDSVGTSRDLVMESGYFSIDRFGDANLDEHVNVGDCVTIVAFIIDRITMTIRQFDAADINRDGRVNIGDLQSVIDLILEIQAPPLPLPPGPIVSVELLRDIAPSGDRVTIPLWADIGAEAAAVQYEIIFNPDHLEAISADRGEMVSDMQFDNNLATGKINGVVYNLGGATFGPSAGEMAQFTFRIKDGDFDPARDLSLREFLIVDKAAGFIPAEINGELPSNFSLNQNYPNPFNASTTISFDLAADTDVDLTIYDLLGRTINTLQNGFLPAGSYSFIWNGRSESGEPVATGIFFYRLRTSSFAETKKMLLVK